MAHGWLVWLRVSPLPETRLIRLRFCLNNKVCLLSVPNIYSFWFFLNNEPSSQMPSLFFFCTGIVNDPVLFHDKQSSCSDSFTSSIATGGSPFKAKHSPNIGQVNHYEVPYCVIRNAKETIPLIAETNCDRITFKCSSLFKCSSPGLNACSCWRHRAYTIYILERNKLGEWFVFLSSCYFDYTLSTYTIQDMSSCFICTKFTI